MPKKSGLEGAFQDDGVTPGESLVGREPDQPGLLDEDLEAERDDARAMFGFELDRSKGGRRPGSRNRSTKEVKRVLQALGSDPVMAAGRVVRGGPGFVLGAGLAELEEFQQLRRDDDGRVIEPVYDAEGQIISWTVAPPPISVEKAWGIWLRCVEFLGPYVHSKQPIDLNVDQPGLAIQINLGSPDAAASLEAATAGRRRWTLDPEKSSTCEDESDEVSRSESLTGDPSD